MIKVVCYVKDFNNESNLEHHHDLCVESVMDDWPQVFAKPRKVLLTIDKTSVLVEAEDLMSAIQNCINNNPA